MDVLTVDEDVRCRGCVVGLCRRVELGPILEEKCRETKFTASVA